MKPIYIKSISRYIPEGRLSNDEVLEKVRLANKGHLADKDLDLVLYGSSRKFEFLGIKTRSYCGKQDGDNAVSMAEKVSSTALEKAGIGAGRIDCLIVSGVTNPFREPSFALVCAKKLGLTNCDFFDINDTCNGFMKSIDVAAQYINTGKYNTVLLITSENPYEIAGGLGIDYRLDTPGEVDNKFAALIAGSGAAAMVVSSDGNGRKVINYCEKRETDNWDASLLTIPNIYLPGSSHGPKSRGIRTDARLISARVIKNMPVFIQQTLVGWNMTIGDVDVLAMHQLGNNVTFATLDKLQAPHTISPINTFNECGNMASANIPIILALLEEQGRVKKGDSVLLASSACGLSYSLIFIEW